MEQPLPTVVCPFLRIVDPDSASAGAFARDCRRHGMGGWMAHLVTRQVTWKQQGWIAALLNRAPDIERLDEVPGVSHLDLYAAHPSVIREQLADRAIDGMVQYQDLVSIKEVIAELTGVDISNSSRIETALLFVMAGGVLDTGEVASADVLRLLEGEAIAPGAAITMSTLSNVRRAAEWSR